MNTKNLSFKMLALSLLILEVNAAHEFFPHTPDDITEITEKCTQGITHLNEGSLNRLNQCVQRERDAKGRNEQIKNLPEKSRHEILSKTSPELWARRNKNFPTTAESFAEYFVMQYDYDAARDANGLPRIEDTIISLFQAKRCKLSVDREAEAFKKIQKVPGWRFGLWKFDKGNRYRYAGAEFSSYESYEEWYRGKIYEDAKIEAYWQCMQE